jgi:hypothetical protein
MNINELIAIEQELEENGRLSSTSIYILGNLISNSENPYSAIILATDYGISSLATEIASTVDNTDPMVRWSSIAALLTHFKLTEYAGIGLNHAEQDSDAMVRGISLVGIGEVINNVSDKTIRKKIAELLLRYVENIDNTLGIDFRNDAYDGILAAMGVSPIDRPPIDSEFSDVYDEEVLSAFKLRYLS